MKWKVLLGFCLLANTLQAQVSDYKYVKVDFVKNHLMHPAHHVSFSDHLGNRIDSVLLNSIKAQDLEHLIEPFRHRNEDRWWQTEFWGKWMLGATKAYEYSGDEELYEMIKSSTYKIMDTQTPDGYIGNYAPAHRLEYWDIWGRKYTMLGMLYFYDLSKDKKVLKSAQRIADHLIRELEATNTNIVITGNFRGMPSSSVLEPIVLLYERTGKERYLNFAKEIVAQWESTDGPQLISKALEEVPVSERFTAFDNWWSWENGQKAYEMMSCYDGLLKLYQVTGESDYLEAVKKTVANIIEEEINIVGSGASYECWYHGADHQTFPTGHTMEVCVTMYWMKLCYELYRFTGDPALVEEMEKTAYNNLLGSMTPAGDRFCKYSSLQGFRDLDGFQCDMQINCCMANGPRGMTLLPDLAVMRKDDYYVFNLFNAGMAQVKTNDGGSTSFDIITDYPKTGNVAIEVQSEGLGEKEMLLRIPAWSINTAIKVNSKSVEEAVEPGQYFALNRNWEKGDRIQIFFDMNDRWVKHKTQFGSFLALKHGPIVLARDNRFGKGNVDDEIVFPKNEQNKLQVKPVNVPGIWMAFEVPYFYGSGEDPVQRTAVFVDFSSAGNTWNPKNRYRVWLPKIFNPIEEKLSSTDND